jgi:hypothetical protein
VVLVARVLFQRGMRPSAMALQIKIPMPSAVPAKRAVV